MAQFDVYRNDNVGMKKIIPYLLDVQTDFLYQIDTRVVVPLLLTAEVNKIPQRLNPIFDVENLRVFMSTSELAGVSQRSLTQKVTNLSTHRDIIIAALDLLFTGF